MSYPAGCIMTGKTKAHNQCDAKACNYPFCEAGERDPTGQALVNDAPAGYRPTGFDPSRYRTERYDPTCTRILCADTPERQGWVVALIEQICNGRWVISVGDRRYTKQTFGSAKAAFRWWQEYQTDRDSDASLAEDRDSGLSGEAVAARPEGIAHHD